MCQRSHLRRTSFLFLKINAPSPQSGPLPLVSSTKRASPRFPGVNVYVIRGNRVASCDGTHWADIENGVRVNGGRRENDVSEVRHGLPRGGGFGSALGVAVETSVDVGVAVGMGAPFRTRAKLGVGSRMGVGRGAPVRVGADVG